MGRSNRLLRCVALIQNKCYRLGSFTSVGHGLGTAEAWALGGSTCSHTSLISHNLHRHRKPPFIHHFLPDITVMSWPVCSLVDCALTPQQKEESCRARSSTAPLLLPVLIERIGRAHFGKRNSCMVSSVVNGPSYSLSTVLARTSKALSFKESLRLHS